MSCIALYGVNWYGVTTDKSFFVSSTTSVSGRFNIRNGVIESVSVGGVNTVIGSRSSFTYTGGDTYRFVDFIWRYDYDYQIETAGAMASDSGRANFVCVLLSGNPDNVERFLASGRASTESEIIGSDGSRTYSSTTFALLDTYGNCTAQGEGGNNFSGGNAPPPNKREKDCMCCDCNDIATMIQRQLMEQAALVEGLKDHIDRRVREEITAHGKQLEAMSLDLQPMMDRMNQMESNLWNGIKQ
jgi:hypothetical protein